MDSTINASNSSLTNSEQNCVEEEQDSIGSKHAQFCETYRNQNWSLPDSIIYYITKNPSSSKCYQKMIQSCKYFFIKNPMFFQSFQIWNGWKWNLNGKKQDLDLVNYISNNWVAGRFCCASKNDNNPKIISFLIPKLCQYDLKYLHLQFQDISFADYTTLSSSAEFIHLNNVIVKYENGNITELEKLVEVAAKVNSFTISSETTLTNITSNTAKELFGNPNFTNIHYFSMENIPDTFDIEEFYAFMKQNKCTRIQLDFDADISDAYKNRLYAIIDELLTDSTKEHYPPLFYFPGMDTEKYDNILELFNTYFYG